MPVMRPVRSTAHRGVQASLKICYLAVGLEERIQVNCPVRAARTAVTRLIGAQVANIACGKDYFDGAQIGRDEAACFSGIV